MQGIALLIYPKLVSGISFLFYQEIQARLELFSVWNLKQHFMGADLKRRLVQIQHDLMFWFIMFIKEINMHFLMMHEFTLSCHHGLGECVSNAVYPKFWTFNSNLFKWFSVYAINLFLSQVGVTSAKTMKLLPAVGRKATQKVIF